jgi:Asp/Glu/hydantoin racemase
MEPAVSKRIALIHAVTVAMEPVATAFQELWPEAECVNILDDSLSVDRSRSPELTPEMRDRIQRLAAYGRDIGADGVLFTCSAFGEAIEAAAAAARWPVLKPNEAMFEAALLAGKRIGMLATFERSIPSMEQEFADMAQARGVKAGIVSACVPEAMAALQRGDVATHNAMLADAVGKLGPCDAVMLAQFSTARAARAVAARTRVPVLTSPGAAVAKLNAML